ncbi:DNA repair protein RecO [Ectothiorhodospiraceae bacterium 2226]|nr:DNA repair protein RecO [Ectothiorhodospiraceae bacterium 2226]
MQAQLQAAFLLHRRPYRDTSALLEVFSRDYGRIGLVARGVRGARSRLGPLLQPFAPLLVSWSGRGELGTLTGAEPAGAPLRLPPRVLPSGFYLNELLVRLLRRHDPHEGLFAAYTRALAALAHNDGEPALRLFERDLLDALGYGLLLDREAHGGVPLSPSERYCYHLELGPLPAVAGAPAAGPIVQGATLLALARGELEDSAVLQEAKQLLRAALAPYLGGRPLQSRRLLRRDG